MESKIWPIQKIETIKNKITKKADIKLHLHQKFELNFLVKSKNSNEELS